MGGTNIQGQIDCSHYVEKVFQLANAPCPDPPVHHQERFGRVVHWRDAPVEDFGKVVQWISPPPLSSLQPGDRVIFQYPPQNNDSDKHHTGIYIGRFGPMEHAVIHCNSTAGTVSIDELTGRLWSIYRYAVRGAQRRRPSSTVASASLTLAERAVRGRLSR
jgi:cell wall-associated NlpC family hydrolase